MYSPYYAVKMDVLESIIALENKTHIEPHQEN
jgi:hypothetical protein